MAYLLIGRKRFHMKYTQMKLSLKYMNAIKELEDEGNFGEISFKKIKEKTGKLTPSQREMIFRLSSHGFLRHTTKTYKHFYHWNYYDTFRLVNTKKRNIKMFEDAVRICEEYNARRENG